MIYPVLHIFLNQGLFLRRASVAEMGHFSINFAFWLLASYNTPKKVTLIPRFVLISGGGAKNLCKIGGNPPIHRKNICKSY